MKMRSLFLERHERLDSELSSFSVILEELSQSFDRIQSDKVDESTVHKNTRSVMMMEKLLADKSEVFNSIQNLVSLVCESTSEKGKHIICEQVEELVKVLSDCKSRAAKIKVDLVEIQGSLSQLSALVNHITEQQKQCAARLALVKTTGLEIRRTKRDHDELQLLKSQLKDMESGSLAELQTLSEKLSEEQKRYEEVHLPTLVSKNEELLMACDKTLQVVENFLSIHGLLLEAVGNTDRITQEVAAWLSSHQRFGHPDTIAQTVEEIQEKQQLLTELTSLAEAEKLAARISGECSPQQQRVIEATKVASSESYNDVVEGLAKLLGRAEQVLTCYKKYSISVGVLDATFTQVSSVLDSLELAGSLDELKQCLSSLTDCEENLKRRRSCLNTMHDQVAEMEALTFTIGEFDVESIDRRYKKYQVELQSAIANLQRLIMHIEEFLPLKAHCDQSILRLSTENLQATATASDGGMESVEAAVAELGQVKATTEELYNSIVSMDTQVQAIERCGGSSDFARDLELVKQSHAYLLSSVGQSQANLRESLGQWRSYEMSLKEVEVQYSRAGALENRATVQAASAEDAGNKLEQQKAKLASLRQQKKSLSLNRQQCLARHKSTQSLESPRTPDESSRIEFKSQQVNSLLDKMQSVCEEDIGTLGAMLEQWNQFDSDKESAQKWAKAHSEEVASLQAQAMPLSSVDKNHFEHQIQLSREDISKRLEELNTQTEQQSRLAGYTLKDQAIENTKLVLQSLLEASEQMSTKLQAHGQTCSEVLAQQNEIQREYERLFNDTQKVLESEEPLQSQLELCRNLRVAASNCDEKAARFASSQLTMLCSVLSEGDADLLKAKSRELKKDVDKLQEKLSERCQTLESSLIDLEQLSVDLNSKVEAAERLGSQATNVSNIIQPVDSETLAALIRRCENDMATVDSEVADVKQMLKDKSELQIELPEADSEALKEHSNRAQIAMDSTRDTLSQAHRMLTEALSAAESFNSASQEAVDISSYMNDAIEALQCLPLGYEAVEAMRGKLQGLKAKQHQLEMALKAAEASASSLESVCGSTAANVQSEKCVEMKRDVESLAEKVRERDRVFCATLDAQQQFGYTTAKFHQKMKSSQAVIKEEISPEQGLEAMRRHVTAVEEAISSEPQLVELLSKLQQLSLSFSPHLSVTDKASVEASISGCADSLNDTKAKLGAKAELLTTDIEEVEQWMAGAQDLQEQIAQAKDKIRQLQNSETTEQNLPEHQKSIKELNTTLNELQESCKEMLADVPVATPQLIPTQLSAAQDSIDGSSQQLNKKEKTCVRVAENWSEFQDAIGQCGAHQTYCQGELDSVDQLGVPLEVRAERYQMMEAALQQYPADNTPAYLEKRLTQISEPADMTERVASLTAAHVDLLGRQEQGKIRYDTMLRNRREFESDLKALVSSLMEQVEKLEESCLTEGWSVESSDAVLHALQSIEQRLKETEADVNEQVANERRAHGTLEEAISPDLSQLIKRYESLLDELQTLIGEERQKMNETRHTRQEFHTTLVDIEAWLSNAVQATSHHKDNTSPAVSQAIQTCQETAPGVELLMKKLVILAGILSPTLTDSANQRLAVIQLELQTTLDETKKQLSLSLEHLIDLSAAVHLFDSADEAIEALVKERKSEMESIRNMAASDLQSCQQRLNKALAIRDVLGVDAGEVEALEKTLPRVTDLLSDPERKQAYRDRCRAVANLTWPALVDESDRLISEMTSSVESWTQLTDTTELLGNELDRISQDLGHLTSSNLPSLPLERLQHDLEQCKLAGEKLREAEGHLLEVDNIYETLADTPDTSQSASYADSSNRQLLQRLKSKCSEQETALLLAIGEHGVVYSELATQLDSLIQLHKEVGETVQQAVGYFKVKSASNALDEAKMKKEETLDRVGKLVSQRGQIPSDIASLQDSIIETAQRLDEEIDTSKSELQGTIDKWEELTDIQLTLQRWMGRARGAVCDDIMDIAIAKEQQDQLESELDKHCQLLTAMSSLTHDLSSQITSAEKEKITSDRENIKSRLDSLTNAIQQRREKIELFDREMEKFHKSTQQAEVFIKQAREMLWKDLDHITPIKCAELSEQCQEVIRQVPAIDRLLGDLITTSLKLGDACTNADTVSKVIDLKDEWTNLKCQLSQQASTLQEVMRLQERVASHLDHSEWQAEHEKRKEELEDVMTETDAKLQTHEALIVEIDKHHGLLRDSITAQSANADHLNGVLQEVDFVHSEMLRQAHSIRDCLRGYESNGEKLETVMQEMKGVLETLSQLNSQTLSPLQLREWSASKSKAESDLKFLEKQADECVSRRLKLLITAARIADNGVAKYKDFVTDSSRFALMLHALASSKSSLGGTLRTADESEVPATGDGSVMENLSKKWKSLTHPDVTDGQVTADSTAPLLTSRLAVEDLFVIDKDEGDNNQIQEKIKLVLGEQDANQASLYDINAQLAIWQSALESQRPGKVTRIEAVLEEIEESKAKLAELSQSAVMSEEESICLSVLSKNIESVRLQAMAEKQNIESSLGLEQSQKDALADVENQLRDCQNYVDQLEVTPDKLQAYLPNLQHQVGRLQRTYNTIEAINPAICEGSTVPVSLQRLTNHLRRLQGRLEVIPEEDVSESRDSLDLLQWKENIDNETTDAGRVTSAAQSTPDDLLSQLSTALHSLTAAPTNADEVLDDLLLRYEDMLQTAARNCSLDEPTLLTEGQEEVVAEITITKNLSAMFDQYRLMLSSIAASTIDDMVAITSSRLSADTAAYQRNCSERVSRLTGLSKLCMDLNSACDVQMGILNKLHEDSKNDTIGVDDVELELLKYECSQQALQLRVKDFTQVTPCPFLDRKTELCEDKWQALSLSVTQAREKEERQMKEVFSEVIAGQLRSDSHLDTSKPLSEIVEQAAGFLGNDESLVLIQGDLYTAQHSTSETRAQLAMLERRTGDIRLQLMSVLKSSSAGSEEVARALSTLCNVNKPETLIDNLDDHFSTLGTEVVTAAYQVTQALHKAKLEAIDDTGAAQQLRSLYQKFSKERQELETWLEQNSYMIKHCPIGDDVVIMQLLSKYKALLDKSGEMVKLRGSLSRLLNEISHHEMCSKSASSQIKAGLDQLATRQDALCKAATNMVFKLEVTHKKWTDYTRVTEDLLSLMKQLRFDVETTPALISESEQELLDHVSHLDKLAEQLEQNSLLGSVNQLTEQLLLAVTDSATQKWLSDNQEELRGHRRELVNSIRQASEIWRKAAQSMSMYEKGCTTAERNILACEELVASLDPNCELDDLESEVSSAREAQTTLSEIDWAKIRKEKSNTERLINYALQRVNRLQHQASVMQDALAKFDSQCSSKCGKFTLFSLLLQSLTDMLNDLEKESIITSSFSQLVSNRQQAAESLNTISSLTADMANQCHKYQQLKEISLLLPLSSSLAAGVTRVEEQWTECQSILKSRQERVQDYSLRSLDLAAKFNLWLDWLDRIESLVGSIHPSSEDSLHTLLSAHQAVASELSSKSKIVESLAEEGEKLASLESAPGKVCVKASDLQSQWSILQAKLQHNRSVVAESLERWDLFNTLRERLGHALTTLDSELQLISLTKEAHLRMTDKIPALKSAFERHQQVALLMRQVGQRLLPDCDEKARKKVTSVMKNLHTHWQSVLSKLISQSEESTSIISTVRQLETSFVSFSRELQAIRQDLTSTISEHHDSLQDQKAHCDLLDQRLEDILSRLALAKFDLAKLEGHLENLNSLDGRVKIFEVLLEETRGQVCRRRLLLGNRLATWTNFMDRVGKLLADMMQIERFYMNDSHLTIEELLDRISTQYESELIRMESRVELLTAEGERLLPFSGEIYSNAIKYNCTSMKTTIQRLNKLAETRTAKLKETLTAILEFESGMQALNSWLVNTERLLADNNLPNFRMEVIADKQGALLSLESNIEHHGRVVTAVINLCSVLQHDQDASQSQRDRQAVASVRQILKDRWKLLCSKLLEKRQWLTDLSAVWQQMMSHLSKTMEMVSGYSREVQRARTSYITVAIAENEHMKYMDMLHEFTAKREELKLVNKRYIYVNRLSMVDTGGKLKELVNQCNDLWDSTYQQLQTVVHRLKHTCQVWRDYEKSRDEMITELGGLSLTLKRQPSLRSHVKERLEANSAKIAHLLGDGATYLMQRSSVTDAGKVETMVKELRTSVDTLKLELDPSGDDVSQVEAELESIISEQDVIDRGLESPPRDSSPLPASSSLRQQASLAEETQRRLNYLDQRIADAEKRAEVNRRTKAASTINMPLAGKPLFQLSSLQYKPRSLGSLHLTTARDRGRSQGTPFERFMASRRSIQPARRRAPPQVTRTRSHSTERKYMPSTSGRDSHTGFGLSSTLPPVTRDELSSEQKTVLQKRQLEVDVRNLLGWLSDAEERSLKWHDAVATDITSVGKQCAQYKEFATRLQQQRSRVLSINIIASMDDSTGSELDTLNSRWEKIQEAMVRHRSNLQPKILACRELERQIRKLSDTVTAIQLELISEVSDLPAVEANLQRHYKAVKSHLSNLSPILAEYAPAEQLMECLVMTADKCKTLLKLDD
ncbi:nesprin-1-like [Watersipora subatra]|uniref:nesprin-1-like n=1 Tax=Watersipora subatra TaxID=2589382 RepID=UPI00355C4CF3